MLNKVGIGLVIATALFVGYLLMRAYKPSWFSAAEGFWAGNQGAQAKPVPRVYFPTNNNSTLEVATPVLAEPVANPPRTISSGGPTTPNARPPQMVPRISPDAVPMDPYESNNTEAPIGDTMRYPERSFGPGTVNDGTSVSLNAGQASSLVNSSVSSFSPEFAQNGGNFMGSVFANDLTQGDEFASA